MAAPTNAAFVKKVLANSEPSTHGPEADIGARQSMSALPPEADIAEGQAACPPLLRRFQMPQGRVELVKRPIYFVGGDHQRGTDADDVVVSVLTEEATQT
jgi:hypothetical protein